MLRQRNLGNSKFGELSAIAANRLCRASHRAVTLRSSLAPPALRSAGLPAPFRAWPRGSTSGFTRPAPNQPKPNILCPIAAAGTQHLVSCPFLAYGGVKGAHKAAARTARRFTRASRNGRRGRAQRPLMQPEADPNPLRQRTGSASPPCPLPPGEGSKGLFATLGAARPALVFSRGENERHPPPGHCWAR